MDQNKVFDNHLKRSLRDGKETTGAWALMGSAIATEILSRAGFDWLIIDMEHGANDITTVVAQLHAMKGSPALPIIRVPWNDLVIIKRVLDIGAYGVLIPYVNTKAEAEAAVQACKYPPEGVRGIAGSTRAGWFGQKAMDYFTSANEEILIITQVETLEAVENLDEILEVPGIDVIFVGPGDLSTNMGHLCNPSHPEVQSTMITIEEKVKKTDKILATVAPNWNEAEKLYKRGYQMVTLMADGSALAAVAAQKVAESKQASPEK